MEIKEKELIFEKKKIKYFVRKSKRAKKIRIEIRNDGKLFLIVPKLIPIFVAENFLKLKLELVVKKLEMIGGNKAATNFSNQKNSKKLKKRKLPKATKNHFLKNKKKAEEIIFKRVEYFAEKYNFKYNKIRIKNNKTNWGSCSSKKNLNFNYRLIFLKQEKIDYIVVHELCHLREMNHSQKFWLEVEKIIPDYKRIRRSIKNII